MVNASPSFVSPDRNKHDLSKEQPEISHHTQPSDAKKTIDKIKEIPRRPGPGQQGFELSESS